MHVIPCTAHCSTNSAGGGFVTHWHRHRRGLNTLHTSARWMFSQRQIWMEATKRQFSQVVRPTVIHLLSLTQSIRENNTRKHTHGKAMNQWEKSTNQLPEAFIPFTVASCHRELWWSALIWTLHDKRLQHVGRSQALLIIYLAALLLITRALWLILRF